MIQRKKGILVLILVCLSTNLSAEALKTVEYAIEHSKTINYDMAFPSPVFQEISSATVYEGSIAVQLYDGTVALESSALFVREKQTLHSYKNAVEYLESSSFIASINPKFLLDSDEDAELFQSFLYLVDGNYFSEGFFNEGTTWYFIRDEFFGDVEAWIVETDGTGHITAIIYSYDMQKELPELRGSMTPLHDVNHYEETFIDEHIQQHMEQALEKNLFYTLEAEPFEHTILSQVWEGTWTKAWLTTEKVDADGYQYTSTLSIYTFDVGGDIYLFGSIEAALGFPVVIESIHPKFTLSTDEQASLFEQALDILLNDDAPDAYHSAHGNTWLFIRDEWFGDGMGFIVKTDDYGKILSVEYSYSIPLGEEIIEKEPPIDPSTVDWTLIRLEPENDSFQIIEGEGISVALEFDAYAANQVGAWMLTELNGEFFGMNYDSAGLYSPYYDWISTDELPVGEHAFSYSLMEPGETPLDSVSFIVTVEPFDASGVVWDLNLVAPSSTYLNSPQGESIPLVITFNDEATKQYKVNLALRHQGEIVGGESSRNLESPFETMIPGSILTPGFHVIDVFLLPPGGPDKAPLASLNITIQVY
jgi:hypothetical protein